LIGLFERFLMKVIPYQEITDDETGEVYLRRFFLWNGKLTPGEYKPRIYLHHILRSDKDRHLHDHPWDYSSIILKGGYFETRGRASILSLKRGMGRALSSVIETHEWPINFVFL